MAPKMTTAKRKEPASSRSLTTSTSAAAARARSSALASSSSSSASSSPSSSPSRLLSALPVRAMCTLICPYLPLQEWSAVDDDGWDTGMFARWDGDGKEVRRPSRPTGCFLPFARSCRFVYETVMAGRRELDMQVDSEMSVVRVQRSVELQPGEQCWRHSEYQLVLYNAHGLWSEFLDSQLPLDKGMLASRVTPFTQAIWRHLLGSRRYDEMVQPHITARTRRGASGTAVVKGLYGRQQTVHPKLTAKYVCDELFGPWFKRQQAAIRAEPLSAAEPVLERPGEWKPASNSKRLAEVDWSYVLSLPSLPHLHSLHLVVDSSEGPWTTINAYGVTYTPFPHLLSLVPHLRCLHLTELTTYEEEWEEYFTSVLDVHSMVRSLPLLRVLRVSQSPLPPAALVALVTDRSHRLQRLEVDTLICEYGAGMKFGFPTPPTPRLSTQWSREEEERESDGDALAATTQQLRVALCSFLESHIATVLAAEKLEDVQADADADEDGGMDQAEAEDNGARESVQSEEADEAEDMEGAEEADGAEVEETDELHEDADGEVDEPEGEMDEEYEQAERLLSAGKRAELEALAQRLEQWREAPTRQREKETARKQHTRRTETGMGTRKRASSAGLD